MRRWFDIIRSAYSSWTAALGAILATIALCNLVFKAMDVPVFETLGWILVAYRKTFHPPLDYLLSIFSLPLPAAAKDILAVYVAMGGILYRTLAYERPSPLMDRLHRRRVVKLRMWATRILIAVFWPYFLKSMLWYPCLLISSSQGFHGRLPPPRNDLPPAQRREVIAKALAQIGGGARVLCNERELLASYSISLLAAVASLVILNAAVDHL